MRRPAFRRRPGATLLPLLLAVGIVTVSCASAGHTRTAPDTSRRAPTSSTSGTTVPPTTQPPTSTSPQPTTTSAATTSTTAPAPPAATEPAMSSPRPTAPPSSAAPATTAAPAGGRLVDQLADTGGATKVITVRSATWGSTTAELMAWERRPAGWVLAHGPWTANVGYAGWSWTPGEAHGYSPIGSFTFGTGFGTGANPGYGLGWFPIGPSDYWVEDPDFSTYNTHQMWPASNGKVPWKHYERLADYPVAYHYAALIDFNVPPSGARRGSGIFLHVSQGGSTAGCVALPEPQLLALLRWIDAGTRIVMAPDDTIRSL